MTPPHELSWYAGWGLILTAFVTGAGLGLFFHREDLWGGYSSFRRRLARLGHIALAALGTLNVLFGLSPSPPASTWQGRSAEVCFLVGGVTMPLVCFLTAWRPWFRHFFFLPVTALVGAVILVLLGPSLGGR